MCFHPQMTGRTPNTHVPVHLPPAAHTKVVQIRRERNGSEKTKGSISGQGIQIHHLLPRLLILLVPIERNLLRTHLDTSLQPSPEHQNPSISNVSTTLYVTEIKSTQAHRKTRTDTHKHENESSLQSLWMPRATVPRSLLRR